LGTQTDAFFAANSIPGTTMTLMAITYNSTLVPVFSRRLADPGERSDVWRFISIIFNINLLLGALLCVIGLAGARWVVALVAPGFPDSTAVLASRLSRILFLTILLTSIVEVNKAILYAHRRFAVPSLMNAVRSVFAAGVILLGARFWGIMAAAAGLVAGTLAQLIISSLAVNRFCRPRYHLSFDVGHPDLRESGRLFVAPVVGAALRQLINIAMQMIGSFLPVGSITALSYANRLTFSIGGFFLNSVTKAALPSLSVSVSKGDRERIGRILATAFRLTLLLATPVAIILIVLGVPLIRIFFQRGAFDSEAVVLTGGILAFFALSIPLLGHFRVIHSYFYAALKARWVILLSFLQASFTVVLDLILVPFLGAKGLALAFSIGTGMATVAGYFLVQNQRESLSWRSLAVFSVKLLVAAMVMALVFWLSNDLETYVQGVHFIPRLLFLGAIIGVGLAAFGVVAIFLRVEEICLLYEWLQRRLSFVTKGPIAAG
jgi:putative peptidoglycan lipid II flippase